MPTPHSFRSIRWFFVIALALPVPLALSQETDLELLIGAAGRQPNGLQQITQGLNSRPGQTSNTEQTTQVINQIQDNLTRIGSTVGGSDTNEGDDTSTTRVQTFFATVPTLQAPENLACLPCDTLEIELLEYQRDQTLHLQEYQIAQQELAEATSRLQALQSELAQVEQQLRALQDSNSWVEANGRRVEAGDLVVIDAYNQELAAAYRQQRADLEAAGEDPATASQDYQNTLREGLTDEEIAKRRQEKIAELQARKTEIEDEITTLLEDLALLRAVVEEAASRLAETQQRIAEAASRMADCYLRCGNGETVDPIEDYGLGQIERPGFFGGIWNWITGTEAPTEPEDTPLEELDGDPSPYLVAIYDR